MTSSEWAGRNVFLTGHTGFKGAWLSLLLNGLGTNVYGYSLPASTSPNLFELARVDKVIRRSSFGDIRDLSALTAAMVDAKPDVVVHLAAKSLVRESYLQPVDAWSTNVMGCVNVLEAVRRCRSVRSVLVVTTDKVYENRESRWGYRELDRLGGNDPYAASKAGAELVVQSYRNSYFSDAGILVATARAGNVIGGGDWSVDRLVPDAARAASSNVELVIRNPAATRPWQHVLDALNGYVQLLARMQAGDRQCASGFNFGPDIEGSRSVCELLEGLQQHWPQLSWRHVAASGLHEAHYLYLDSTLARSTLDWRPRWTFAESVSQTARWYSRIFKNPAAARDATIEQLNEFFS